MEMLYKEAFEFFEEIYYGSHHFPGKIKEHGNGWSICHSPDLSIYDYNTLTRLIFLAHDKCYRLSICQGAPGTIKIVIHKRSTREGRIDQIIPTIETALSKWREDHPIKELEGK